MLLADGTYTQGLAIWAVTTSDGIILHDTAFDYMVEDQIVNGLRQMGLNAADIKYAIVSHGHSDHYFGAKMLQDRFGTRIIMSEADWELVASDDNPPEVKPRKDMVATDGMELTLGDTTLTLYLTPGHTPGTLSFIVPVFDKGHPHMLAMWGGTNVPNVDEAQRQYLASFEHFERFTKPMGVDVELSNHPFVDGSLAKMETLRANPDGPNPFVIGPTRYGDYTGVLKNCALARAARSDRRHRDQHDRRVLSVSAPGVSARGGPRPGVRRGRRDRGASARRRVARPGVAHLPEPGARG
jgi:metallo-beta-lactamase class B